jgi:hypothetical protein
MKRAYMAMLRYLLKGDVLAEMVHNIFFGSFAGNEVMADDSSRCASRLLFISKNT